MAETAKLQLELADVYGKPLKEKVDVILRHQVLSEVVKASVNATTTKVQITGLRGAPQGLYRIDVDPPSYQYVSQFVNMKASGITPLSFTFPVDPGKVTGVNFPAFSKLLKDVQTLLENSSGVFGFEDNSIHCIVFSVVADEAIAGLTDLRMMTS